MTKGEEWTLLSEQRALNDWLKTVRFRKKLFGGVAEEDLWKKLQELNDLYEAALRSERTRYEVLLEMNRNGGAADGQDNG